MAFSTIKKKQKLCYFLFNDSLLFTNKQQTREKESYRLEEIILTVLPECYFVIKSSQGGRKLLKLSTQTPAEKEKFLKKLEDTYPIRKEKEEAIKINSPAKPMGSLEDQKLLLDEDEDSSAVNNAEKQAKQKQKKELRS